MNVVSSRLYTVGTTVKKVIGEGKGLGEFGRKGAANRCQTDWALKGKRNSTVEPAKRGARMALIVP